MRTEQETTSFSKDGGPDRRHRTFSSRSSESSGLSAANLEEAGSAVDNVTPFPSDSPALSGAFSEGGGREAVGDAAGTGDLGEAKRANWIARNGHTLTFVGIFAFTIVLYFRPYEFVPALSFLKSSALYIAVGTLCIFVPTQLFVEGRVSIMTTEVKALLFLAVWSVVAMPIAIDRGMAWASFTDGLGKITIMFVMMANAIRTRTRLTLLTWLSIGVGMQLAYQAIELYQKGEFKTEGYRISVQSNALFTNANELATHLVIFVPVVIGLALGSKNWLWRIFCFLCAGLMAVPIILTQSRGGFLGLIAVTLVMAWKLGRKNRFQVLLITLVLGVGVMAVAPGNYAIRLLSIFDSSLDPNGSSGERSELLKGSIIVTLRNPLGVGLGNSSLVGIRSLETHNSFTQVSSELGWVALLAYLAFLLSPVRKLRVIEHSIFSGGGDRWIFYMSVGLQASIVGFMICGFFGSFAYHWFVYYPVAYAICLQRLFIRGLEEEKDNAAAGSLPAAAGTTQFAAS